LSAFLRRRRKYSHFIIITIRATSSLASPWPLLLALSYKSRSAGLFKVKEEEDSGHNQRGGEACCILATRKGRSRPRNLHPLPPCNLSLSPSSCSPPSSLSPRTSTTRPQNSLSPVLSLSHLPSSLPPPLGPRGRPHNPPTYPPPHTPKRTSPKWRGTHAAKTHRHPTQQLSSSIRARRV